MFGGSRRLLCGLTAFAGVLFVSTFYASVAEAAPRRGKGLPLVVLVPAHGEDKVQKAHLDSIDRALINGAVGKAELAPSRNLDKRNRVFASAVAACKSDKGCLTKLIKTTKADAVLVPSAKMEGTTKVATDVMIVSATDVRIVAFSFGSMTDLNNAIATSSAALYANGPATSVTAEPALEGMADLPLEPLDTAPAVAAAPAVQPAPVVNTTPPPTAVTPAPPPLESPTSANALTARVEKKSGVTWKTWVGTGALVVGAAALTYGIIQYNNHKNIVNDANNDPALTQRDAVQRNDDAQSAYDRSRIGLYAGIPLAVIGAGLLTWDLALGGKGGETAEAYSPRLKIGAAPSVGGVSGAATLTW